MYDKHSDLITQIEQAFEDREQITANTVTPELQQAIEQTITLLDQGEIRVAAPSDSGWQTHEWIKKAVLLYFRSHPNQLDTDGPLTSFDKVPLKYANYTQATFERDRVRVVPGANVRLGAHVAPRTVLMPSYVNMGAYIGEGSMIDTWATVGSCAQIGAHVHISGGAGIGGVLEPLQASPTIIEDNCFIGARSEVVEGVIVEHGAVIAMGVFIGKSTKIYNRSTGEITYGRVPANAVVVPGSLPSADGSHSTYCAVIIKQVDDNTRAKTSINSLLRD